MEGIDPNAFEFALGQIKEGFVFEQFGHSFLNAVLGYEFVPVGGIHDRAIDGLEHTFHRDGFLRQIYQLSIEKNAEAKIERTFKRLAKEAIEFQSLTFVTNQFVPEKDQVTDRLFDKYQKTIRIFDLKWLSSNANHSESTIRAYNTFIESYLHEFNKPGKSFAV